MFVLGTIVPQGPSEKRLCDFCLLFFYSPPPLLNAPVTAAGEIPRELIKRIADYTYSLEVQQKELTRGRYFLLTAGSFWLRLV